MNFEDKENFDIEMNEEEHSIYVLYQKDNFSIDFDSDLFFIVYDHEIERVVYELELLSDSDGDEDNKFAISTSLLYTKDNEDFIRNYNFNNVNNFILDNYSQIMDAVKELSKQVEEFKDYISSDSFEDLDEETMMLPED